MFTVKHTKPDYNEALYTCSDVRYQPAGGAWPNSTVPGAPEAVFLCGGDAGLVTIERGVIYVMNDAGSTVAKYDLELKHQTAEIKAAA